MGYFQSFFLVCNIKSSGHKTCTLASFRNGAANLNASKRKPGRDCEACVGANVSSLRLSRQPTESRVQGQNVPAPLPIWKVSRLFSTGNKTTKFPRSPPCPRRASACIASRDVTVAVATSERGAERQAGARSVGLRDESD